MLEFCPPHDSYEVAWVNNGFSRCFIDTASSVVSSTFLLVAGFAELVLCKPKPVKREKQPKRPWTPWMIVVIVFCLLQVWCTVPAYGIGDAYHMVKNKHYLIVT